MQWIRVNILMSNGGLDWMGRTESDQNKTNTRLDKHCIKSCSSVFCIWGM